MRAGGPAGDGIDPVAYISGGIVAGEAELSAGTILDQEIQREEIPGLHVRIVARGALDVSPDQLHGPGGVGCFVGCDKRSRQVDIVLEGQGQAERVCGLQVGA